MNLNQKDLELYFSDTKNKRTLDILTALRNPRVNQNKIGREFGVCRQTVSDIKFKYIKSEEGNV